MEVSQFVMQVPLLLSIGWKTSKTLIFVKNNEDNQNNINISLGDGNGNVTTMMTIKSSTRVTVLDVTAVLTMTTVKWWWWWR